MPGEATAEPFQRGRSQIFKSFLLLFFKKEVLAFARPYAYFVN